MTNARLSIVVPTRNRADILAGLLESLDRAQRSAGLRMDVWVLVNGDFSGYGSIAKGTSDWDWLKWLWDPTPGLARTRNRALREINATFLAFLDDDARVDVNWFTEAEHALRRFPGAAAYGGPYTAAFEGRPRPKWLPQDFGSAHIGLPEGPVRFVSGGNMIVAREMALAAGGFPEHLGMTGAQRSWGEETALFLEFERRGQAVVLVPSMTVSHIVKPHLLTIRGFLLESWRKGLGHYLIFPPQTKSRIAVCLKHFASGILYIGSAVLQSSSSKRTERVAKALNMFGKGAGRLQTTSAQFG